MGYGPIAQDDEASVPAHESNNEASFEASAIDNAMAYDVEPENAGFEINDDAPACDTATYGTDETTGEVSSDSDTTAATTEDNADSSRVEVDASSEDNSEAEFRFRFYKASRNDKWVTTGTAQYANAEYLDPELRSGDHDGKELIFEFIEGEQVSFFISRQGRTAMSRSWPDSLPHPTVGHPADLEVIGIKLGDGFEENEATPVDSDSDSSTGETVEENINTATCDIEY